MENKDARDKIISIFRKYARTGLHYRHLNTLQAYRVISSFCHSENARLDLLAVHDTLRLLNINGENEVVSALYAVYFATASHRLKKSEITRRICRYAIENYCDERTVYRRLLTARSYYQKIRKNEEIFEHKIE